MTSRNLQKELARKLIWAVTSTLHPPETAKKRVRAWGWRLAGKMLDAKEQFTLPNTPSSRYHAMAGGGADGRLEEGPSASPLLKGGNDAVPSSTGRQSSLALRGALSPSCRWFHPEAACCERRDCWWSGPGSLWRPTGIDDWGRWSRWWSDPQETQATRIDRRRYADNADDRVRGLQKGCRELHIAAHKALVEDSFSQESKVKW